MRVSEACRGSSQCRGVGPAAARLASLAAGRRVPAFLAGVTVFICTSLSQMMCGFF